MREELAVEFESLAPSLDRVDVLVERRRHVPGRAVRLQVAQGSERVASMVDRLRRFARLDEADMQMAELEACIDTLETLDDASRLARLTGLGCAEPLQ